MIPSTRARTSMRRKETTWPLKVYGCGSDPGWTVTMVTSAGGKRGWSTLRSAGRESAAAMTSTARRAPWGAGDHDTASVHDQGSRAHADRDARMESLRHAARSGKPSW